MEIQSTLLGLEQKYQCSTLSFAEILEDLESRYSECFQSQEESSIETTISEDVVIPDETYVEKLLSNLSTIKNHFGDWEYKSYQKGLQQILWEDDFEDGEEIMNAVHELIKKYIYRSDTKVSINDWQKLEQYIEQAGYVAVSVKAGDSVTPYRSYFERPIPASGGTPNTIKQIQQKPYSLKYCDGDEISELKLCGKCTYFK